MEGYMDHGKQVSKVQIFLQNSLSAVRKDREIKYNLQEEFAKTRHNRDWFVFKMIGGTVAVVVVLVAGFSFWAGGSSKNVKVDISVFEDLNLKRVLDIASRAEARLASIAKDRASILSQLSLETDNIRNQMAGELDILALQRMNAIDRAKRKADIERAYAKKERDLKASFDARLVEFDREMDEVRKQIESFDTKRIDEARAQKQMMDSQRDLYELEKASMQKSFDAKILEMAANIDRMQKENATLRSIQIRDLVEEYQSQLVALDPAFNDPAAVDLLEGSSVYAEPSVAPFTTPPQVIPAGVTATSEDFVRMNGAYTGLAYLLERVSSIPYVNESGDYVDTARKMALANGATSEKVITESFARIGELDTSLAATKAEAEATAAKLAESEAQLARTREAKAASDERLSALKDSLSGQNDLLSAAAKTAGHDGYVTDSSDPASPGLLLLPESIEKIFASAEPKVYIYREKKTLVAIAVLSRGKDGKIIVTIEEYIRKREPMLMDFVSFEKL
jgi:ferredoxin-NADP reductase